MGYTSAIQKALNKKNQRKANLPVDNRVKKERTKLIKKKNVAAAVAKTNKNLFIEGTSIIEKLKTVVFRTNTLSNTYNRYRGRYGKMYNNQIDAELDGSYAKIDHIPGLKTTLYPHQKTAVCAMLDLELTRSYDCKIKTQTSSLIRIESVSYNAAVLSEPVGSGKTIDILAIICLLKKPRAIPDIMSYPTYRYTKGAAYIRRYFKKFFKPTLIFVGSSVMRQWQLAIRTFTDLTFFSVNNVFDLKKLLNMIETKTVNNYDIVLVKNGKITVDIKLPSGYIKEDKNKISQPFIYNILANLRDCCWYRVVIDDFDTIKLPHNASIIPGIFTWFVSSTRKQMKFRDANPKKHVLASDIINNYNYGCANIMSNDFLFRQLNVRNNLNYLKSTTKMPCPKYHVAIFVNPNNRYISLLGSMGDTDIRRITEMLNGDALDAAAEAAGIKSSSVADIFGTILGKKFKTYRFAGDLIGFIEYQEENKDSWEPIPPNVDTKEQDEDEVYIYRYGKRDLLKFRDIEYKFPNINRILHETHEEYTNVKKETGKAIDRVKGNIKHGNCPVCHNDLDDAKAVWIVKCCQTVFCDTCGIMAQNLRSTYNNKLQRGRCSNCRSSLTLKDLIYIGDDINIDDIEEENFESDSEEEEVISPKEIETVIKERTKYSAIIDIVKGIAIPEDKRVDLHIPNMMKGTDYLPEAKTRKVLIFANFDETLKKVIKELEKENIHFWRLQGGISEIDRISCAFTEYKGTCAMVINSTRHCSGLNLQTATDLIFAHRMHDPAVESQVAGRGHRLGRQSPLNIWYMLYDNEYNELKSTHSVRELTQSEITSEEAKVKNNKRRSKS